MCELLVCSNTLRVAWHNNKHINNMQCKWNVVSVYICVGAHVRASTRACARAGVCVAYMAVCVLAYVYDTYILDNSAT